MTEEVVEQHNKQRDGHTHLPHLPTIPTCYTHLPHPPATPTHYTHLPHPLATPPATPTCHTHLGYRRCSIVVQYLLSGSRDGRPWADKAADTESWNCKILQEQGSRKRDVRRRKEKVGEGQEHAKRAGNQTIHTGI